MPLYDAFDQLAAMSEPWRRALVGAAHRVANADARLTPKERERLVEIEMRLLGSEG